MDYTPIRITTIPPNKELSFELFIHFKDQFLKYVDNGDEINNEKLLKLKKQNIARFYIRGVDEDNYQIFLDEILEQSMEDPDLDIDKKVNLVDGTAKTALDKMTKDPSSEKSVRLTKSATSSLRKLVFSDPNALKVMFGKTASQDEILMQHSLNVSALSISLAQLKNATIEVQDNLGLAGILHDIGIVKFTKEEQSLFHKVFTSLEPEEKKVYQQHPQMAVDMLSSNKAITPEILDLILHHEEKLSGDGYPQRKSQLTFEQEALSMINCYDKKVTLLNLTPKEAVKSMKTDELGNYNLELINTFTKHLKEKELI
ncbi:HD domain-containing protein [Bacteriovoracaceae bacterium]|nr:HD domain-containing protein [Bacteriovoracaceae bacterium]